MTASLLAPARAVLSGAGLTSSECYELAIAARCLPGYWDVQWDRDDRGHISIALLQDDIAIESASVFLIWREDGRLHLGMGDDERYAGLGAHTDMDGIMDAVRRVLARITVQ